MKNSVWFQIQQDTRENIKSALLENLGTNNLAQVDKKYMQDICLCISSIAVVEIPSGSWDNFVEMMCTQAD